MGSSDVKLQYIDDEPDSYSNIWNNAKTDITEADQSRLIQSLKTLASDGDIASVVDMEQVIRYFVVHNFVCNDDSYTGMMVHNYYLYEEDGRLAMIPWDYNLGFGTFSAGDATSTVNTPIDSPVSGGSGDERPMWNWIVSDETYTELYYQYFAEFLGSVDIQGIIDDAYELIKTYVEKDPTAFYTYEEFELGVETLRQFCTLRNESISMQLESGETTEDMGYADVSSITLSDMGSMNGGGMGGFGGDMPGRPDGADDTDAADSQRPADPLSLPAGQSQAVAATVSSSGEAGDDELRDAPGEFEGRMPEGFDPSALPGGFVPSELPEQVSGEISEQASGDAAETTPSGPPDMDGSSNAFTPARGCAWWRGHP